MGKNLCHMLQCNKRKELTINSKACACPSVFAASMNWSTFVMREMKVKHKMLALLPVCHNT